MQNNPDKPLPSVELSLKYLAWDVKQLKEALIDLNNNIKLYIGMQRSRSVSQDDGVPF